MHTDSEKRVFIDQDRHDDSVSIYLIERVGNKRIFYTYNGEMMVANEQSLDSSQFQPMKPVIKLPHHISRLFLPLLHDAITESGINTKKVDMQAGKTELLEQRLTFSDQQLVKFIDYFTSSPRIEFAKNDQ